MSELELIIWFIGIVIFPIPIFTAFIGFCFRHRKPSLSRGLYGFSIGYFILMLISFGACLSG